MKTEKRIGTLITYDIDMSKFSAAEITKFRRELYGWRDYSNHGKYQYDRPGMLTKIPYMNPDQSVLIIPKEHSGEILTLFARYEIGVFSRDVILKEGDLL